MARSAAEIHGDWIDPGFESGLIWRCRSAWNKRIDTLTDEELATFIRQNLGFPDVLIEARNRLASGKRDETELYEGELEASLKSAQQVDAPDPGTNADPA